MKPITAKLSKKERTNFLGRVRRAGVSQSEVVRVALAEFFVAHPTSPSVIDAVIKRRSEDAAKGVSS